LNLSSHPRQVRASLPPARIVTSRRGRTCHRSGRSEDLAGGGTLDERVSTSPLRSNGPEPDPASLYQVAGYCTKGLVPLVGDDNGLAYCNRELSIFANCDRHMKYHPRLQFHFHVLVQTENVAFPPVRRKGDAQAVTESLPVPADQSLAGRHREPARTCNPASRDR
jgi:hypothetical protein